MDTSSCAVSSIVGEIEGRPPTYPPSPSRERQGPMCGPLSITLSPMTPSCIRDWNGKVCREVSMEGDGSLLPHDCRGLHRAADKALLGLCCPSRDSPSSMHDESSCSPDMLFALCDRLLLDDGEGNDAAMMEDPLDTFTRRVEHIALGVPFISALPIDVESEEESQGPTRGPSTATQISEADPAALDRLLAVALASPAVEIAPKPDRPSVVSGAVQTNCPRPVVDQEMQTSVLSIPARGDKVYREVQTSAAMGEESYTSPGGSRPREAPRLLPSYVAPPPQPFESDIYIGGRRQPRPLRDWGVTPEIPTQGTKHKKNVPVPPTPSLNAFYAYCATTVRPLNIIDTPSRTPPRSLEGTLQHHNTGWTRRIYTLRKVLALWRRRISERQLRRAHNEWLSVYLNRYV